MADLARNEFVQPKIHARRNVANSWKVDEGMGVVFTSEIFTSTGTTACHDSADYRTLYDSESLERELSKKYRFGGSASK